MKKSLIISCFPIIRRRQAIVTIVFFECGSTKTLRDSKKHVAGEIMFEFPDQIVCHADSFFIGRPVPALAMDDYLCNSPIPRSPTGVIEGALWTRVYSSRQPYVPAHRKNGNGGVSNKLLSEVVLDQPARMTLYTTPCGN
uniref:Uncharacterized protein n=1 Tax=Brassica campestris TaxID=3711 RepID=M4CXE9_BRACM